MALRRFIIEETCHRSAARNVRSWADARNPESRAGFFCTWADRWPLMRCYFHLTKGNETIKDDRGIEVPDLDHARTAAIKTIAEIRATKPRVAEQGAGWTLVAADASGAVLFTIPLDVGLAS